MTDIRLIYDNTAGHCDWVSLGSDLDTSHDLETAVLLSLFTDARAPDGTVPPDGTGDLRGCWIDYYEGWSIGSLLWTIEGTKKVGNSLLTHARTICEQALQWLIDDGIIGTVGVSTSWINGSTLKIDIVLTSPKGVSQSFQYAWAWKDENAQAAANPH